jgi:hypothetical protein
MVAGMPQAGSSVADDRHISQLPKQIRPLREVISLMADRSSGPRGQSELLFRLIGELRGARLAGPLAQADDAAPWPGATRSRLHA